MDVKCWTADRKVVTYGLQVESSQIWTGRGSQIWTAGRQEVRNGLWAERESDMDCRRIKTQVWTVNRERVTCMDLRYEKLGMNCRANARLQRLIWTG